MITAPVSGTIIPLEELSDPVFSQQIMGPGVAILPDCSAVSSPVEGRVVKQMPHAVIFDTEYGGVLLHLGIDSVELSKDHFNLEIPRDRQVHRGQDLGSWQVEQVRSAGVCEIVVLICLETACEVLASGHIRRNEPLLKFLPPENPS